MYERVTVGEVTKALGQLCTCLQDRVPKGGCKACQGVSYIEQTVEALGLNQPLKELKVIPGLAAREKEEKPVADVEEDPEEEVVPPCEYDGCEEPATATGWCGWHSIVCQVCDTRGVELSRIFHRGSDGGICTACVDAGRLVKPVPEQEPTA